MINRLLEKIKYLKLTLKKYYCLIFLFSIFLIWYSCSLGTSCNEVMLGIGTGLIASLIVAIASDIRTTKKVAASRTIYFAAVFSSCRTFIGHLLWMSNKCEQDDMFRTKLRQLTARNVAEFRIDNARIENPEKISGAEGMKRLSELGDSEFCLDSTIAHNAFLVLQTNLEDMLDLIDDICNNTLFLIQNDLLNPKKIEQLKTCSQSIKLLHLANNTICSILIENIIKIYQVLQPIGPYENTIELDFYAMMSSADFRKYIDDAIYSSY